MNRTLRFLYLHKVIIFNLLFCGFVMVYPPGLLNPWNNHEAFNYYSGVAILGALFFEFAGIWYKGRFIYSLPGAREMNLPFIFKISIWPRLLISVFFIGMAFKAMGFLERSDFLFLLLILYAGLKEFWVRTQLLRPEDVKEARDPAWKVWMGEVMLFVFACVVYVAFWEFYLLESPKVLLTAKYPQNYPLVALIFLVFLLSTFMPYLVEEYLRPKKRSQKVLALVSFLLPTAALVFQLFKLGYLH